jgi:2-C-methyl-D-erythritol 4-phosphate cytidylyltransferase
MGDTIPSPNPLPHGEKGTGTKSRSAVVAVVLGAGQGARMGANRNKVLLALDGVPILVRALAAFERSPGVDETLLVAYADELELCRVLVREHTLGKVRAVIAGGVTRHQSEDNALNSLRPRIEAGEIATVLIHDGARPLVTPDEIETLLAATAPTGGALLAAAIAPDETLLQVDAAGHVLRGWPPAELALAQTPQAFDACRLLAAYDAARATGFEGSDTAASFERAGGQVRVVFGHSANLKITTPDDLLRAEALLAAQAR